MKHLAAFVLVLVLLPACGRKLPCKKPEEVVSTFYLSMRYRATGEAFQLIAGPDKRVLTQRAEAVSAQSDRPVKPHELLVPGLVAFKGDIASATFKPVKVEVGDVTEVEVTFGDATTVRTPVVREAGCYRIPLGLETPSD